MSKVNVSELEWTTVEGGDTHVRRKKLAASTDAEKLGCSFYELREGCRSWPYHYHTSNEEAIYVLEGEGMLRLDGEAVPIEAGDYIALPASEDGGHRVINDSTDPVRYLVVSTMNEPDVTVYPDSEKIGVFVGSPPGGSGERSIHGYYNQNDTVEYWDNGDND